MSNPHMFENVRPAAEMWTLGADCAVGLEHLIFKDI